MKKGNLLFLAGLLAAVFLLYWRTLDYDLIWDDQDLVRNNSILARDRPVSAVFQGGFLYAPLGVPGQDFYYRPLTMLAFFLENRIWGMENRRLRFTNVLIFNASLIFLFLFLLRKGGGNFAHVALALFAFFPLHSDHVVWIVGRGDLLLLFWGSVLLLLFDLYLENREAKLFVLVLLSYAAGIFCKETFILFLPLVVLYEFCRTRKISFFLHVPLLLATMFFFLVKSVILKIGSIHFSVSGPPVEAITRLLKVIGYYARSLAFPFAFDRLASENDLPALPYAIFGVAALAILAGSFYLARRNPSLLFPLALILLPLLAYSLLSFTDLEPFRLASRYMMLPALGLAWMAAVGLTRSDPGPKRTPPILKYAPLALILSLFAFSTVNAASAYRNEVTFWTACRKNFPRNAAMNYHLAKAHLQRGEYLPGEAALDAALAGASSRRESVLVGMLFMNLEYLKADFQRVALWEERVRRLVLYPSERYEFEGILARVHWSRGEFAAAESVLARLVERFPQARNAYLQLHELYLAQTLWEKAARLESVLDETFSTRAEARAAVEKKEFASLSPERRIEFFIAHRNFTAAIVHAEMAPRRDLASRLRLAYLYYRNGREKEADLLIGGILGEGWSNFRTVNTVGLFYLDRVLRRPKALSLFRRSLQLNGNQPRVIDLIRYLEAVDHSRGNGSPGTPGLSAAPGRQAIPAHRPGRKPERDDGEASCA